MSSVPEPEVDLPRGLTGGSDLWDQPQASVIFDADFFDAAPSGGGGTPTPLVYGSYLWSGSVSALTYTFPNMAIGPAASDRWVIAAFGIHQRHSGGLTSVTIGGVAATKLYGEPTLAGSGLRYEFWKALVPTGTTANIAIVSSGDMWDGAGATYYCSGEPTYFDAKLDLTFTGTTFSVSIDVPEGGALIAHASNDDDGAISSWVGVTADASDDPFQSYFGSASQLNAQTGRTVSFTATAPATADNFYGLAVLSVSIPLTGGGGAQTLTPPLVDEGDTFFAPTVVRGAVTLSPPLHSDSDTFFASAVFPGAVVLVPPLVSDTDTFFAATILRGAVSLAPPLIADSDTFFAPVIIPGTVTLATPLVDEADTFWPPTIVQTGAGTQTLAPPLVDDGDTFFAATVLRGLVILTPPMVADADTFFAATAVRGAVALVPPLVSEPDVFFAAVVVRGAVTLSPPLVDGGDTFFAATVLPGAVVIYPPLVDDGDFFWPLSMVAGALPGRAAYPSASANGGALGHPANGGTLLFGANGGAVVAERNGGRVIRPANGGTLIEG